MTVRIRVTPYGIAALDALRAAVTEAKSADPMTPVTVIAPNNIAGIVARRFLAQGTDVRPGIAGLEVTTLSRLAERIAAPLLAPRRPATGTVLAAAWREALAGDPRCFHDIADHPATIRALVAAHTELRDLSATGRKAVQDATAVGHDLVTLHDAIVSRLRAGWFDATDLLTVAAEHAEGTVGAGILYLPQDLTQAEARFAAALAHTSELTIIAARTGVRRADRAVERAIAPFGTMSSAATTISTASRVINASDSDDEVRCVVRDLMRTLETTPAHRVAVLYAAAAPYARLLHEQLAAAGVTANGAGARAVDERAVARTLLEVLALADGDVPRSDLFRSLANAPVRDFAGHRIPISTWERASRAAGVVAGEDWNDRLGAYVADRHNEVAAEQDAPDARDWLVERLGRDAHIATELRAFATRLRDELRRAAGMSSWLDLTMWCLDLFTTLLGDEMALQRLPVEEQYAAAAVVSTLHGLAGLDAVDTSASLQTLNDVVDAELAGTLPRVGRFGAGVFVGPISSAVGLDLDVVYLVGLSEDLYPGRPRADGLLPDRARVATNGELASQHERLHAKYRHLLVAFASAKEAVASFPRGDLRRSTRRLPSRWLLGTLRELSGDDSLAATAWDHPQTYGGTLTTAGSFAAELTSTSHLSTRQEWRTRQAAARRLDDDVVRAAVEMCRARSSDAFTRYDGNLAQVGGLPDYATDDISISPTALEGYAECPHSFFVGRLLGVQPLELPEDVVQISPLEIGNLIHGSVDALVKEFADRLPAAGQPWTPEQHARLVEIAVARADEFRRRGLTGHPRLWERERARIIGDVGWLLTDEDGWRAGIRAAVVASELPFGIRGQEPVKVSVAGGRVRMRGSADRIDQGADGTLYVTDLKTGGSSRFKNISQDDPLVGGTKLQLPIYAYAARARFGAASTPVSAAYWFVRKDRGRITVALTTDVESAYSRAVGILVRSIAAGLFPPKAPDQPDFSWVQCAYCNPDGIGHADNRERWERKRHDPKLRELVELIESDALEGRP